MILFPILKINQKFFRTQNSTIITVHSICDKQRTIFLHKQFFARKKASRSYDRKAHLPELE